MSHVPKAEIDEKSTNFFSQAVEKHWREGEKEENIVAISEFSSTSASKRKNYYALLANLSQHF